MWIAPAMVPVLIIVALCILVEGQGADGQRRGEPCTANGVSGVWHGPDRSKGYICCKQITITKGSEVIPCTSSVVDTGARACEEGFFQEHRNKSYYFLDLKCREKSCRPTRFVDNPLDRTEPAKCKCDKAKGYYNKWHPKFEFDNDKQCRYKECPAGTELTDSGDCQRCPIGKFKNETNKFPCKVVTPCYDGSHTRTTDTICGNEENASRPAPSESPPPDPAEKNTPVKPRGTTPAVIIKLLPVSGEPEPAVPHRNAWSNGTVIITVLVAVVALLVLLIVIVVLLVGARKFRRALSFIKGRQSQTSSTAELESNTSSGNCSQCSVAKYRVGEECELITKTGGPTEHVCMEGDENEDARSDNMAAKHGTGSAENAPLVRTGATSFSSEPQETRDDSLIESGDTITELPNIHLPVPVYCQQISKDSAIDSMNDSTSEEGVEVGHVQGGSGEEKNEASIAPPLPLSMTSAPPPYSSVPPCSPLTTPTGPPSISINININGNINGDANNICPVSVESGAQVHKTVSSPPTSTSAIPPAMTTASSHQADETEPKTVPPYPDSKPAGDSKVIA